MKSVVFALMLFGSPLAACPVIMDPIGERDSLIADLTAAHNFSTAQHATNAIWSYWHIAPDAQSQEWLTEGVARIRQSDLEKAEQILSGLTEYCPNYAEGFNQLAFAQFLAENYDASEANLKRTLELEPKHFGALSGLGLIAQRRGKLSLAKIWIKRAVAIHPFLNERFILDIPDNSDPL
jgi:tetratricopeptide (TPR) repeat protein